MSRHRTRSGDLRRRITIQRNTPTQDGYGEQDASWATLKEVWAEIEPLNMRETFGSDMAFDEQPTVFRFRYGSELKTLKPTDRIQWNSTNYDLIAVKNVEQRNKWFECVGVVRG